MNVKWCVSKVFHYMYRRIVSYDETMQLQNCMLTETNRTECSSYVFNPGIYGSSVMTMIQNGLQKQHIVIFASKVFSE